MKSIEIDARLKHDTIQLGSINGQALLLMNNSLVPWFVVLPNTRETELYKLAESEREVLEGNINILSEFIQAKFPAEKLNVASIGNVVSQMHIHIVGRCRSDFCWPGVVWGQTECEPYTKAGLNNIIVLLEDELAGSFTSCGAIV